MGPEVLAELRAEVGSVAHGELLCKCGPGQTTDPLGKAIQAKAQPLSMSLVSQVTAVLAEVGAEVAELRAASEEARPALGDVGLIKSQVAELSLGQQVRAWALGLQVQGEFIYSCIQQSCALLVHLG